MKTLHDIRRELKEIASKDGINVMLRQRLKIAIAELIALIGEDEEGI